MNISDTGCDRVTSCKGFAVAEAKGQISKADKATWVEHSELCGMLSCPFNKIARDARALEAVEANRRAAETLEYENMTRVYQEAWVV